MDLPNLVTATLLSCLTPEDNVHLYQRPYKIETPDSLCLWLSEALTFPKASPLLETGLGELVSKRLTSGIFTLLHPLDHIAEPRSVTISLQ